MDDDTPDFNASDYDEYVYEFVFDDYNQHIVIAIAFAIASVLGIFGNTLVIFSVFASKKLRTVTNAFVVNLSVADLITSLMIPFNVEILLDTKEYPIKDWGCAIVAGILFTCIGTSLFTLASIALNRLMLITRPMRTYRIIYSPCYTGIWLAATWLIPFSFNIIPPLADVGQLGLSQKYRMCVAKSSHPKKNTYDYIQVLLGFPVPLVTLVVSYVWIYLHLHRHSKSLIQHSYKTQSSSDADTLVLSESEIAMKRGPINNGNDSGISTGISTSERSTSDMNANNNGVSSSEKSGRSLRFSHDVDVTPRSGGRRITRGDKRRLSSMETVVRKRENTITKNMFLVFIAFVICFFPTAATLFFDESAPVVPYSTALLLINACINPIIYGFKHPIFNKVFKCLLTCNWKGIPEPSDAFQGARCCYCRCR